MSDQFIRIIKDHWVDEISLMPNGTFEMGGIVKDAYIIGVDVAGTSKDYTAISICRSTNGKMELVEEMKLPHTTEQERKESINKIIEKYRNLKDTHNAEAPIHSL